MTEIAAGGAIAIGLLTSLQCGAVVGIMTVASVVAHRTNGFFIFKPGQGWEYAGFGTGAAAALLAACSRPRRTC